MKKLKVILIGAGCRGCGYTDIMKGDRFEIVAVAEPREASRAYIQKEHSLPDDMCFATWEPLLALGKIADVAVIATMDKQHYDPAMKAIELGYDLLLEKPVSPDIAECVEMANAAKEKGVKILVCHVLRYTPFFRKIKELINGGMVGRVMSIHHAECVGNEHQSHSFVRGNWGNSEKSSPMILQKSCHDMDILQWLVGTPCSKVQSFGSLSHFVRENAPEDAPEYCLDGCPHADDCYYHAEKIYLKDKTSPWHRILTASGAPTDEEVISQLKKTQFGKCVYKCDNNVVDHQVVNLEFEGGAVASFNMCAFNEGGRHIRIMGNDGEISGDMEKGVVDYYSFRTKEHTEIDINAECADVGDHSGGDSGIIDTLYRYIAEDYEGDMLSEIGISVKNHMIAFAAEKARIEGTIINMREFEEEAGLK